MAVALAEAGADVVAVSRRKDSLEEVANQIRGLAQECLPVEADVTEESSRGRIVKYAFAWKGRIDILCNNAGVNLRGPAEEVSLKTWESVIETNLTSAFFLAQSVARTMIERKSGKIINTGSISSFSGSANVSPYAASKGGLLALTRALAVEWAKYNIQVNCLIPGVVRTELTKSHQDDPEKSKWIVGRIPAGRWSQPEDLQGAVVFLASSASDYMTGASLVVDGGWLGG